MSSAGGDSGDDGSSQADWMRSGLNVDPDPTEAPLRRRRFLTSVPGVVAGAAAIITALSVGVTALTIQGGPDAGGGGVTIGSPSTSDDPDHTGEDGAGGGAGAVPGQIDVDDVIAALTESPVTDEATVSLMRDCANRNATSCDGLVDRLVEHCSQGAGSGCDLLYRVTVVGSPLGTYGATCGGRLPPENAGRCSQTELLQPAESPPPR